MVLSLAAVVWRSGTRIGAVSLAIGGQCGHMLCKNCCDATAEFEHIFCLNAVKSIRSSTELSCLLDLSSEGSGTGCWELKLGDLSIEEPRAEC